MSDAAEHLGPGGQPFDHNNADIVVMFMDQKMGDIGHLQAAFQILGMVWLRLSCIRSLIQE